jgi:hypothetical protein
MDRQRESGCVGEQPDRDLRLRPALLRESAREIVPDIGLDIPLADVERHQRGRAERSGGSAGRGPLLALLVGDVAKQPAVQSGIGRRLDPDLRKRLQAFLLAGRLDNSRQHELADTSLMQAGPGCLAELQRWNRASTRTAGSSAVSGGATASNFSCAVFIASRHAMAGWRATRPAWCPSWPRPINQPCRPPRDSLCIPETSPRASAAPDVDAGGRCSEEMGYQKDRNDGETADREQARQRNDRGDTGQR